MKNNSNLMIALALVLGNIPFIIVSLVLHPIGDFILYSGVFATSNQMGFTCAAVAAGLLIILIASLSTKNSLGAIVICTMLLLGVFIVLLLANARTSIICLLVMLSIFCWRVFSTPKSFLLIIFLGSLMLTNLFLFAGNLVTELWEYVQAGFMTKGSQSSISGRNEIWEKTLNDASLLGHGHDYFEKTFSLSPHNTLIGVLGQNGMIAASILLFFAIASFMYSYWYFKENEKKDSYAIAPFMITTCFWIISMGEGMFGAFGNSLTLAYMISMGILMTNTNYP
jgi:O-antigen ligase